MIIHERKPITPTQEEAAWIAAHGGPGSNAELCWRYAAMFNSLDVTWIHGVIDEHANYSSQSVFEEIDGCEEITQHLERKMILTRTQDPLPPTAALADYGINQPCVALYKAASNIEISAWDEPRVCISIKSSGGLITEVFIITALPEPSRANASGLFPLTSSPEKFKPPLHNLDTYSDLSFSVFVHEGTTELEQIAMGDVKKASDYFSGSNYEVIREEEDVDGEAYRHMLLGFPTLLVKLRGEVLLRTNGVPDSVRLINRLSQALG